MTCSCSEHEGCFLVGIAGDFSALMAGGDEEGDDGDAAGAGGEVERGVGLVSEVGVEEKRWV